MSRNFSNGIKTLFNCIWQWQVPSACVWVRKAKGWITLSSFILHAVSMYSTLFAETRPPVPIRRTPADFGWLSYQISSFNCMNCEANWSPKVVKWIYRTVVYFKKTPESSLTPPAMKMETSVNYNYWSIYNKIYIFIGMFLIGRIKTIFFLTYRQIDRRKRNELVMLCTEFWNVHRPVSNSRQ